MVTKLPPATTGLLAELPWHSLHMGGFLRTFAFAPLFRSEFEGEAKGTHHLGRWAPLKQSALNLIWVYLQIGGPFFYAKRPLFGDEPKEPFTPRCPFTQPTHPTPPSPSWSHPISAPLFSGVGSGCRPQTRAPRRPPRRSPAAPGISIPPRFGGSRAAGLAVWRGL